MKSSSIMQNKCAMKIIYEIPYLTNCISTPKCESYFIIGSEQVESADQTRSIGIAVRSGRAHGTDRGRLAHLNHQFITRHCPSRHSRVNLTRQTIHRPYQTRSSAQPPCRSNRLSVQADEKRQWYGQSRPSGPVTTAG